jgi:predicted GIY-YIG superfamily endonuclease
MWYVYILRCTDGDLYTGCTNNVEERVQRHKKGYVEATKNRLPVELVWFCFFRDQQKAYEFEKYLKTGSGRAFKSKHLI